jgi:hypothetical protein
MCENTPYDLETPLRVLVCIRPFRQFSRLVWIVDAPVSDSAYKSLRIVCIVWYVSLCGCVVCIAVVVAIHYMHLDCGYTWCSCFLSLLLFLFTCMTPGKKKRPWNYTTGFLLFYCFPVWFASMIDQADKPIRCFDWPYHRPLYWPYQCIIDHITGCMTFYRKKTVEKVVVGKKSFKILKNIFLYIDIIRPPPPKTPWP